MGLDQCMTAKKLYALRFNFLAHLLYKFLGHIFRDYRLEDKTTVTMGLDYRASSQRIENFEDGSLRYRMQDVCLYFIERYCLALNR